MVTDFRSFLPISLNPVSEAIYITRRPARLSTKSPIFHVHCRGMVESAFEFADICRKHDFHNFVFSMKASNPLVMVAAYRLLAEEQYKRGWDYPLHLGVTGPNETRWGTTLGLNGFGCQEPS